MKHTFLVFLSIFTFCSNAVATGNIKYDSFSDVKKLLLKKVYYDHKETFYCKATFDKQKNIVLPEGFTSPKFQDRLYRLEWEHIIPAENFGKIFIEWREGHPDCINKKGKPFKGRKCAELTNQTFRYMQADMYNLYPAIGAVNAYRLNYKYTELPDKEPTFGSCSMKIYDKSVEPPVYTRGAIARTYLYFEEAYPQYKMNKFTKTLMEKWNQMYPVDEWECKRNKRIEKLQGNVNHFVKDYCPENDYDYSISNLLDYFTF